MSEFDGVVLHPGEAIQINGTWIHHPLCYLREGKSKCVGTYAKEYAKPIPEMGSEDAMKCIRVIARVHGEDAETFQGSNRIEHELHWLNKTAASLREELETMEEFTQWMTPLSKDC